MLRNALILSALIALLVGCKSEKAAESKNSDEATAAEAKPAADKAEAKPAEGKAEMAKADHAGMRADDSGQGAKAQKPKVETLDSPPKDLAALGAVGKRLEPPIEKAAVPADAWYCDMGTVHYARSEEGDGRCPLCKMKLVHNTQAAK